MDRRPDNRFPWKGLVTAALILRLGCQRVRLNLRHDRLSVTTPSYPFFFSEMITFAQKAIQMEIYTTVTVRRCVSDFWKATLETVCITYPDGLPILPV